MTFRLLVALYPAISFSRSCDKELEKFRKARYQQDNEKYETLVQSILVWLGSRVVSVLESDAEGPGFKSQSRRCRVT